MIEHFASFFAAQAISFNTEVRTTYLDTDEVTSATNVPYSLKNNFCHLKLFINFYESDQNIYYSVKRNSLFERQDY